MQPMPSPFSPAITRRGVARGRSRSRRRRSRDRRQEEPRSPRRSPRRQEKRPSPTRRSNSRRGATRPPSPRGRPPNEQRQTTTAAPKSAAGGGKAKCPICWLPVSKQVSGQAQHRWLSEKCLQYQLWDMFTQAEQEDANAWHDASLMARQLKRWRAENHYGAPSLEEQKKTWRRSTWRFCSGQP